MENYSAPMIEVRGLVKSYGISRILDRVSLSVRRGEVAAILGPSGAGKSTLLRCINGLETFEDGEIQVDGILLRPGIPRGESSRLLPSLRRKVGMVFQQFNLFPHLSVFENVASGPLHVLRRPREAAEAIAKELLERVGLGDKLRARPEELSGGQQQRVAIARALALNPEAILFDEPTSALDPRMAAEVMSVIADLASSGQTMILVTHAIAFARQFAHSVHVMVGGRIVESGAPGAVLEDPQEELTRTLLVQDSSKRGAP